MPPRKKPIQVKKNQVFNVILSDGYGLSLCSKATLYQERIILSHFSFLTKRGSGLDQNTQQYRGCSWCEYTRGLVHRSFRNSFITSALVFSKYLKTAFNDFSSQTECLVGFFSATNNGLTVVCCGEYVEYSTA